MNIHPCKNLFYSHWVIKIPHNSWTLSRSGMTEAGVVGVTDDALYPWQGACRGHGFVGEVAWKNRKESGFHNLLEVGCQTLLKTNKLPHVWNNERKFFFLQSLHEQKCEIKAQEVPLNAKILRRSHKTGVMKPAAPENPFSRTWGDIA